MGDGDFKEIQETTTYPRVAHTPTNQVTNIVRWIGLQINFCHHEIVASFYHVGIYAISDLPMLGLRVAFCLYSVGLSYN